MSDAAIVGIGATPFTDGTDDANGFDLALESILAAVEDAGLDVRDIDGIVKYSCDPSASHDALYANLGLDQLTFWAETPNAGAGSCAAIQMAAMAVETGQAKAVVCFRSYTSLDYGEGLRRSHAWLWAREAGMRDWARPYGWGAISMAFALQAQRHMHEFGTTERQLGAVVAASSRYAARNPLALRRDELSIDEYLEMPFVTSPLRALDCFVPSSGACAAIVTSADRARDLRQTPAFVAAAVSQSCPTIPIYWEMWPLQPGLITNSVHQYVAERLYERTGMRPADIDVAQLYDCYSIAVLTQLEAYGFCPPGESGSFVEDGAIDLGGTLPVNTHGGLLSEAYIHGFNHIAEGVRQIRGSSTSQVDEASTVLVTSAPGPAMSSAMILTKEAGK